jgi:hypothetical protein
LLYHIRFAAAFSRGKYLKFPPPPSVQFKCPAQLFSEITGFFYTVSDQLFIIDLHAKIFVFFIQEREKNIGR